MKKILFFLVIFLAVDSSRSFAQIINPDFDIWTSNSLSAGNAPDPNSGNGTSGWWDFNVASNRYFGGSPLTVFKDSTHPVPFGNSKYCATIVSDSMTATSHGLLKQYGFYYPDTNGILFNGYIYATFLSATIKRGIPFTSKITSFSFYYQYLANGQDTCSCSVWLYHWSNGVKNLIGSGYWYKSFTVPNWTQDSVVITYDSTSPSTQVDTISIQFSACSLYSHPQLHDTLSIDSTSYHVVHVNSNTGIDNISQSSYHVTLYPDPAQNEVNVILSGQAQSCHMSVYDITGRTIGIYSIENNILNINTQSFTNGLYLYKITDNNGNELSVGKFSVVH